MDKVGSRLGTDDDVSCCIYGAGRGGRTPTRLPSADFETVEASSSLAQNHMDTATYETSSFGSVRFFEGL